jgi:hypothetical protein
MKKTLIALFALAFMLAAVTPVLAQDPVPDAVASHDWEQETKTAQAERMGIAPTALRKEIVKLKYVRAEQIVTLLRPYFSNYGTVQFQNSLPSVLSLSDTPENVEKILAAIRELDVKAPDVQYTIQLVLGSETDAATDTELQGDPIVKELRKLLRFKGYTLLDTTLMRTVNGRDALVKFGPKAEFELYLRPDVAGDAKAAAIETRVRLRQTQAKQTEPNVSKIEIATLIESTLNVKSGERTVVGVSKLDGGGKGLILIISAKIVD